VDADPELHATVFGTPADESASWRWIESAEPTAPLAVSKMASTESPAMSITRPWLASMAVRKTARARSSAATVPGSSKFIRRE
jgi:hypothetical protein